MDYNDLPPGWKQQATALSESAAGRFRWRPKMRREIILDDDCPLQISVVIIDERGKAFRLNDGELSMRIEKSLNVHPAIIAGSLYSLPTTEKASFGTN